MSTSPDRGRVLRGGATTAVRPARMDAELRTSPFALAHTVDARLTDPHLEQVVSAAAAQAAERGHAEGYAAGHAEGIAAAAAEAAVEAARVAAERAAVDQQQAAEHERALVTLHAAAEAFRQREALALAEVEDTVVEIALRLARAVLDRELAVSDAPGREALARALALAPEGVPLVARLHPDDAAALPAGPTDTGFQVTVVADPSVEPGGCVVDGGGRHIDAQIGPALERAAAVLR